MSAATQVVAWTVTKQHDERGDAYQARALSRFTVRDELGPWRCFSDYGDEGAYRMAEADGAASGLPYVDSHLPWSRPVASTAPAQPGAATPAPRTATSGTTFAASYSTSVIETPAAAPPVESRPGSGLTWSPSYGKR